MTTRLWKVRPSLQAQRPITVGPTSQADDSAIWFGQLAETTAGPSPQVWLSTSKEHVVAVVGKRGSGKSFTLGVIAEGYAVVEDECPLRRATNGRAILLFDPLDIYWTTRYPVTQSVNAEANRHYELARAAKLTELTFNVLAWIPGEANRRTTDPAWFQTLTLPVRDLGFDEWELLLQTSTVSDPQGQCLVDALELTRKGYTVRGEDVKGEEEFDLLDVAEATRSDALESAYHRETLRAVRQRLRALHGTGLFSKTGTSIRELAKPDALSVIMLGRLAQSHRSVVVAVLTRMLIEERGKTAFAEKRLALDPSLSDSERRQLEAIIQSGVPKTVVALDEAQAFLSPASKGPARGLFIQLVKEGRNMGISAVVATQQPSALDNQILSQVETFIAHQLVTEADIAAVQRNLKASLAESWTFGTQQYNVSGLLRALQPGQCLLSSAESSANPSRSMLVQVRPRASVHGGIEL